MATDALSNNNNNNNSSSNNNNNNIKNGAYVIDLDEYGDIGTHWVALYVNNKTIIYFDSFGVQHIPKEIMKFIGNKNMITNIFRIQAYDSIMCGYFCIGFINFMFNGNSNLEVSKANRANEMSELNDLIKFRLDEMNEIKDYLNSEIKERKDIIKKISKYIAVFDYADKLFIILSASFCTLSIASHATILGISVGIAGASLTLIFTVTTGVVKKLLNIKRKKKKIHNKIIALARSKLNIIENLISQPLIDFEITHEEFSKIIYEKNNYEQIIDNIKSVKSINDFNKEND